MATVSDLLASVFCTASRYLPCRHKTGLFRIGQPDRNAPVFVSGNFFHTVSMLTRRLKGIDCYLLVADSAGINVWCAAGTGDFTEHKIADAVNTCALADVVDHRDLVLPQLAAVGIDREKLLAECGFRGKWGPASYLDIKEYLKRGGHCTDEMRHVSLSVAERLRVATGMLSVYLFFGLALLALVFLFSGAGMAVAMLGLAPLLAVHVYAAAFADKMFFKWPTTNILFIGLALLIAIGVAGCTRMMPPGAAILYGGADVLITILMCIDYIGSTVDYKTTVFHWLKTFTMRSLFQPEIGDSCDGCGQCANVCPKRMYDVESGKAGIRPGVECCECLACVKQCERGAITNRNGRKWKGDIRTIPDIDRVMN